VNEGIILPLILTQKGLSIAFLLTNRKGFEKSLENKEIWYIHPVSKRLISLGDSQDCSMVDYGTHYSAEWLLSFPPVCDWSTKTEAVSGNQTIGTESGSSVLDALTKMVKTRRLEMPEGSYTTHLFQKGESKIRKKLGEEAVEIILATTDEELLSESADFFYHLFVLLEFRQLNYKSILEELKSRFNT